MIQLLQNIEQLYLYVEIFRELQRVHLDSHGVTFLYHQCIPCTLNARIQTVLSEGSIFDYVCLEGGGSIIGPQAKWRFADVPMMAQH